MRSNRQDIDAVLSRRHDNGADYWAGPGGKLYVGNPYSTLGSLGILHELGVTANHEAVAGALALILEACRPDGKIKLGPTSPLYPCFTAEAARMLCRFGLAGHEATAATIRYLVDCAHTDGGWRCSFKRFGSGPETRHSNPGATLYILDVLRFRPEFRERNDVANKAVSTLLEHWSNPGPRGPCHWGIGSRFNAIEYPFLRYNLFYYVYILSFYSLAIRDSRFKAAYKLLTSKLGDDGSVIVENPHRRLKGLKFCAKGQPSPAATRRLAEVQDNLQ